MIFADKLIQLRKKNGWSQEELAEQMNVTRQAVSKWEGAQSIPDFDKMIRLSELFGVSTDYLLKDSIEETDPAYTPHTDTGHVRRITMEEASSFLSSKETTSKTIAYGVLLCILSPLCLMILTALSEVPGSQVTEAFAVGAGLTVLLLLVAAAVAVFISAGSKTAPYEYLETEEIETEYGVTGMVKALQSQYRNTYTRGNIIGASLCILSLIALFAGSVIAPDNALLIMATVCCMMAIAGIGVVCFVRVGIIWSSFEKLLQEGDYTRQRKKRQPAASALSVAFWMVAVAAFLTYSFVTEDWMRSWIILAVAGVLYPGVIMLFHAFGKKEG